MGFMDNLNDDFDFDRDDEVDNRETIITDAKKIILDEATELFMELKENNKLQERRQFENNIFILFERLTNLREINKIELDEELVEDELLEKIREIGIESKKIDFQSLLDADRKLNKQNDDDNHDDTFIDGANLDTDF